MTNEKQVSRFYPICYYIGLIVLVLGVLMIIPAVTAAFCREAQIVSIFLLSSGIAMAVGCIFIQIGFQYRQVKINFGEGTIIASLSWLIGMLLCALPLYLSGSYGSYLDSCFDVMSGLTTTGVFLIQDLDHVSNGINMWRHLLTFLGGQGMVVLALTFLSRNYANVYMMYVGEGKDEKLSPNAVTTSRSIWRISMLYLVIGTIVMSALIIHAGLPAGEGILHGMWIFMSAWSTGGFAPMSQNMLYYHDLGVEVGSMIFFLIGSFNFALHYAVMRGHRSEIRKNIETVTFTITLSVLTIICITGLMQNNVYPNFMAMFRKGFYLLASGHTTTGFMSVYAKQFFYEWGDIALFAIITAMLFGGSACSTAGGFKALRIGIVFKAVKAEISRMLVPDSRIRTARIHHIRDMILSDSMVKSAALIILLYILTFAIGMLAGMYAGYPAMMAAFESASVTGNVGLSIGITAPSMPAFLKITYLVIMWLGRLEFMSVFTLIAYAFRRLKRA
ncbi:MAG: hypothetical protein LKF53_00445 [Solobacterium sp.]|jgi:trk system potassium uptake protein TrkH|nr:hypothetical protein [Solobacterium sp.]MCH4204844.1 hypothetical protein [Solobacterium sp.]MCH4226468.1 hypothetical protein [Solobacterium sp.]MCH4283032.1 hypothetical protein [Solobacterium sp.]